jgi:hypothetical protein
MKNFLNNKEKFKEIGGRGRGTRDKGQGGLCPPAAPAVFAPPTLICTPLRSPCIHLHPPAHARPPHACLYPPVSPSHLVAAVAIGTAPAAAGGSDGAGAMAAAVASVPAHFIVWLFVLVLVAPDWPYFVLAHTHLGLFMLICLYQIQS